MTLRIQDSRGQHDETLYQKSDDKRDTFWSGGSEWSPNVRGHLSQAPLGTSFLEIILNVCLFCSVGVYTCRGAGPGACVGVREQVKGVGSPFPLSGTRGLSPDRVACQQAPSPTEPSLWPLSDLSWRLDSPCKLLSQGLTRVCMPRDTYMVVLAHISDVYACAHMNAQARTHASQTSCRICRALGEMSM